MYILVWLCSLWEIISYSPGQILSSWEEEKFPFYCFMEVLGPFLPLEALDAIYQISCHRKKLLTFFVLKLCMIIPLLFYYFFLDHHIILTNFCTDPHPKPPSQIGVAQFMIIMSCFGYLLPQTQYMFSLASWCHKSQASL